MKHRDHLALLRPGIPAGGGTWADLGCGSGAFTLALAELLGPQGLIYAVDKDAGALDTLSRAYSLHFNGTPGPELRPQRADFARDLALPPLDGVVMANSLHFSRKKEALLQRVVSSLRPGGAFILVEYNAARGNLWVPYPIPYLSWEALAQTVGLTATRLLERRPSSFMGEIYAAGSRRPPRISL